MTRRKLILALPQLADPPLPDPWLDLQRVWNPFAEKLNHGVLDLKQWKKVLDQIHKMEGKGCKTS